MVSNEEFLRTLFGEDYVWAHVTGFGYDPGNIPAGQHLIAWRGNYFCRSSLSPSHNQYFTVSTFYADEKGQARRRKALYRCTHVIVLDDVREKLPIEQVQLLPPPTWILETSSGSEQWGYKLTTPSQDRHRVDNLLDGLVSQGLAPDGTDPGMKGVTRYVRLPGGVNTKASKLVNGQPWQCRLLLWEPSRSVTLEALAQPFAVNLDAARREQRVDGAASVDDHPLLAIPDLIHIKEERSGGRFDITCPWVEEHTNREDNGAGLFTNSDGTIGFKCHHGSCQGRTGADLLRVIEEDMPGFGNQLKAWQMRRAFSGLPAPTFIDDAPIIMVQSAPPVPSQAPIPVQVDHPTVSADSIIQEAIGGLRRYIPGSSDMRAAAEQILKQIDPLPAADKIEYHTQIRDILRWTKPELKHVLEDMRRRWYKSATTEAADFYSEVVYIRELNQFYDRAKRIFYTPEAYQNSYAHLDAEVRKSALQNGLVMKVDKLDYAPLKPAVFQERGVDYVNTWIDSGEPGAPGDISWYLEHFAVLGWSSHMEHILQWMAYTIRHPDIKINHMLILGSAEGGGKDWLLYPLAHAMGDNYSVISGEELLTGFHDYALSTKFLHINETELGDRREAAAVAAALKPLAAAPPETLRINQKNIKPVRVRNILSGVMTTNSNLPVRLNGPSRRFFAAWSDIVMRGEDGNMLPHWQKYWTERWEWMKHGGGMQAVVHYLRHVVDLSNFNPGLAPQVTDYLREIQDSSKSPMQQTIESFIRNKTGIMNSDLVTSDDVSLVIRSAAAINPSLVYCDPRNFTPHKVAQVLGTIPSVRRMEARNGANTVRLYCLRDYPHYSEMSKGGLFKEYEAQHANVKPNLSIVR